MRGIHRSPVNSPHKCGALIFSLICVWINVWVNNRKAGDLRRYRAHYDVIVMNLLKLNSKLIARFAICQIWYIVAIWHRTERVWWWPWIDNRYNPISYLIYSLPYDVDTLSQDFRQVSKLGHCVLIIKLLWNSTGTLTVLQLKHLATFTAIGLFVTDSSPFWDFPGSDDKMSDIGLVPRFHKHRMPPDMVQHMMQMHDWFQMSLWSGAPHKFGYW